MPLFRGTVSWKGLKYRYRSFEYMRKCGYLLKKHAELWAPFWKNMEKLPRRAKDMHQFFDDFVAF